MVIFKFDRFDVVLAMFQNFSVWKFLLPYKIRHHIEADAQISNETYLIVWLFSAASHSTRPHRMVHRLAVVAELLEQKIPPAIVDTLN